MILLSTYDTVAILTGLTPFSNYIFSITSGNDISFLDRNVLSRTAFIAVTTLERGQYIEAVVIQREVQYWYMHVHVHFLLF